MKECRVDDDKFVKENSPLRSYVIYYKVVTTLPEFDEWPKSFFSDIFCRFSMYIKEEKRDERAVEECRVDDDKFIKEIELVLLGTTLYIIK